MPRGRPGAIGGHAHAARLERRALAAGRDCRCAFSVFSVSLCLVIWRCRLCCPRLQSCRIGTQFGLVCLVLVIRCPQPHAAAGARVEKERVGARGTLFDIFESWRTLCARFASGRRLARCFGFLFLFLFLFLVLFLVLFLFIFLVLFLFLCRGSF